MALPPGPRAAAAIQTFHFITRPLPFFEDCRRRFGDIFTIKLLGVGRSVHVTRPDTVRELFTAPPEQVHAGDSNSLIEPLVGRSSVALVDEGPHARLRRLMTPPMHGQRMRRHGRTIMEATRHAVCGWRPGEVRTMLPAMQDISLEVILQVIFGITERKRLPEAARNVLAMVAAYTPALLLVKPLRRDLGPLSPGRRFLRRREVVDRWLMQEIAERREHADPERIDVLSLLLQARTEHDEPLTDREVRDQLTTLFVAGQDTTSAALAWALAQLHAHPKVLERLVAELDTLGPDPDPEKLAELPYLTAVCNESLRAIPTVFAAARMAVRRPFRLQGFDIDPGIYISPNIHLVHRDPGLYPEPLRFRPERFLERQYAHYEFLPFGGGPRRCLGMALSFYEMRLVLGTLLSTLRLQALATGVPPPKLRGMVTIPRDGARLRVLERRPAPTPARAQA